MPKYTAERKLRVQYKLVIFPVTTSFVNDIFGACQYLLKYQTLLSHRVF